MMEIAERISHPDSFSCTFIVHTALAVLAYFCNSFAIPAAHESPLISRVNQMFQGMNHRGALQGENP
jgi:hypothetical protein